MRLLLDTRVLLWWLSEDERLTKRAIRMIADAQVYVSAASAWEMAIKSASGKLRAPDDFESQLRESRFQELPVTIAHASIAAKLPMHHKDPFDRMLIAQALQESLTLLTHDEMLPRYNARVMLVSNL
jgi:PIN domain nuclease of toxin-antitoxin system